jgi:ribose 5-phosphate isomerase B
MKIYVASDHAGFKLKEVIKPYLQELGYTVEDCGAHVEDIEDDYVTYIVPCAQKVAGDKGALGVVFGASGEGEAMAANRVLGARAFVYYGETIRKQTDASGIELGIIESGRMHNDANILSLGARFLSEDETKDAVKRFLETSFSGDERHIRRIEKLG